MDLERAVFVDHSRYQMNRRSITEAEVRSVLSDPLEVLPERPGRIVAQKIVADHLVRVFVDIDRTPPEVVTVYRTSNIAKYVRTP